VRVRRVSALVSGALLTGVLAVTAGCSSLHGRYLVTLRDVNGDEAAQFIRIRAEGNAAYIARDAACSAYPKALVTIRDVETGRELEGESPFQCR
jgi:hypothetical protein